MVTLKCTRLNYYKEVGGHRFSSPSSSLATAWQCHSKDTKHLYWGEWISKCQSLAPWMHDNLGQLSNLGETAKEWKFWKWVKGIWGREASGQRKLCETWLPVGREFGTSIKCYRSCLSLLPQHPQNNSDTRILRRELGWASCPNQF